MTLLQQIEEIENKKEKCGCLRCQNDIGDILRNNLPAIKRALRAEQELREQLWTAYRTLKSFQLDPPRYMSLVQQLSKQRIEEIDAIADVEPTWGEQGSALEGANEG